MFTDSVLTTLSVLGRGGRAAAAAVTELSPLFRRLNGVKLRSVDRAAVDLNGVRE